MERTKTSFLQATVLLAFSVFLAAIASEVAYRWYLSVRLDLASGPWYQAVNAPTSLFSEPHGYDYVASRTFTMATIQEGKVSMCNQIVSNSDGNLGRDRPSLRTGDATILVVGDSFSDNAHLGGLTWPDLMGDELSRRTDRPISVLNYSRSGYGMVQMMSMAAEQVKHEQPELLVIPFILNDLTRPRFWRTSREKNGQMRLIQSAKPDLRPRAADSFDVSLVDAEVDDRWCRFALEHPGSDDPVLTRLNDRYKQLAITSHQQTRLTSLSESLLYRRIVKRDFTLKQARMVSLPALDYSSYAEDPEFMADLQLLKDSGVPIALIRLPLYEELVQGAYLKGTAQEESLLNSLEQLTASPIGSLLPPDELPENIVSLFLLPQDSHPSADGAAFYAREVSNRIPLEILLKKASDRSAASETTPLPSQPRPTDRQTVTHS